MLDRGKILFENHKLTATASVLLADTGSFVLRHAVEFKAAEDFVIFLLTVAFLVWQWRRAANKK